MRRVAHVLLGLAVLFALWEGVVRISDAPHFILPGPGRVLARLWDARALVAANAGVSYAALLAGLALGVLAGMAVALGLASSPLARVAFQPALVTAQSMPIFALAPVLTLWLGYGPASKVAVVALITAFPVALSFFDGLMRLPQGYADLARVMGAGPGRVLFLLRLPHALPSLASGLRLATVQAPVGVVLGEWAGASAGLGYLMLLANGRAQTDLMFAALLVLAAFTVPLYFAVDAAAAALARRFAAPAR